MAMYTIVVVGVIGTGIVSLNDQNTIPSLVYIMVVLMILDYLLMLGAFRVLIRNHCWKVWQVVAAKLAILIAGIGFLLMATDIIINEWASDELKDFIFIYIFGLYGLLT